MKKALAILFLALVVIAPASRGEDSRATTAAALFQKRISKAFPGLRDAASAEKAVQSQTAPIRADARKIAAEFRYRYVSFDPSVPAGFLFLDPAKIDNDRTVYATAYACDEVLCIPSVATYQGGVAKILHQNAVAYTANAHGVIGGSVVLDLANFVEQAAIFDHGDIKLIPRTQGEVSSRILRLTDTGIALVQSDDGIDSTLYLYKNGHSTKLDFTPYGLVFLDLNDGGMVAGTLYINGQYRAFRFNPSSGKLGLLNPQDTEPDSWGLHINRSNDVLGYSFISGGLERIGMWRNEKFLTSFVEGTPQYPTISNYLLWNSNGLIVITYSRQDRTSYLVPSPGVRLNIADLVEGAPPGLRLDFIHGLNDRGDMIGFDFNVGPFMLERLPNPQ